MKKIFVLMALSTAVMAKAQKNDSLSPLRQSGTNEFGLSVSSAIFVLSGVTDHTERYTNATFRHLFPKRHAIKVFTGVALFNSYDGGYEQSYLPAVGNTTIYPTTEKSCPSNFQVGVGYEYLIGKRKLKHVFGADVVYNNKFERTNFYYMKVEDPSGSGTNSEKVYTRIDTGAYVRGVNYDKFGFNLSYSLRYEASRRWVFTASCIGQYRFYRREEKGRTVSLSDFNMNGLISDISIFYRF